MPVDRQVFADRTHKFAPPDWRMFDALTQELDKWLILRPREVMPPVLSARRPDRVVWGSLWPVSPDDLIEFEVCADGLGSSVRFMWRSASPPDERGIGLVRHHLNEAIGAHLREWVDTEVPLQR